MNILLTNDDGYNSKGLLYLAAVLKDKHKVFIVAPEKENSGASHSLSFVRKLHYRIVDTLSITKGTDHEVDCPCHVLDGTPADCTKFAIEHLYASQKFDLVIAGINTVLNVGTDAIYSGTFGAASEASILGVKGIAVSVLDKDGDYSYAAQFVADNLEKMVLHLPEMVTLNVNIPSAKREGNKGVKVVPIGLRRYNDWYEETPSGYQLTGYTLDCSGSAAQNDAKYIDQGYITVTPVRVIARDEDLLEAYSKTEWVL